MIKDWIISPDKNDLWKAEIIADVETINKIESMLQEIQENKIQKQGDE